MRTLMASEVELVSGGAFVRPLVDSVGWANGVMAGGAASMIIEDALAGAELGSALGPAGALFGLFGGALVGGFVADSYTGLP